MNTWSTGEKMRFVQLLKNGKIIQILIHKNMFL